MAQGRLLSAPREAELTLGLCSHTGPNSRASDGSTFGDASDHLAACGGSISETVVNHKQAEVLDE